MVANKGASGVKLCSPPSARHNDKHLFSIAEEFPAFLHKGGEPSLSVRCMLTSLEAKIAHASGVRAVTRALSDFSKRPPCPYLAFLTPFVVSIYDMSLSEHCQIFRPRRGPSSYIDPGSASIERYAVCKSETGGQPIDAGATGSPVWRGKEGERGDCERRPPHLGSLPFVDEESGRTSQDVQKDASSSRPRYHAVDAVLGSRSNQLRDVV